MTEEPIQTEFEFTLPQGYVDSEGNLHREGKMRLATAADEIEPLQAPQVQSNSSYMTVIILARVITELGTLDSIHRQVIENLFVKDLEYLQELYARINHQGSNGVETACPACEHAFEVDAGTGAIVDPGSIDGEAAEQADVPDMEEAVGNRTE